MNRDELAQTLAFNFSNNPEVKKLLEKKYKKLTLKQQQIQKLSRIFRRANLPFDTNQIESEQEIADKLADIIMEISYKLADKIIMLTNQK